MVIQDLSLSTALLEKKDAKLHGFRDTSHKDLVLMMNWQWTKNIAEKAETHINKLSEQRFCRILDLNGIIVLICIFV
jgi:hypothetical protein